MNFILELFIGIFLSFFSEISTDFINYSYFNRPFVLVYKAPVTLFKIETSLINFIYWLAVTTGGNIMRSFGETVAAVITVSSELFFFL